MTVYMVCVYTIWCMMVYRLKWSQLAECCPCGINLKMFFNPKGCVWRLTSWLSIVYYRVVVLRHSPPEFCLGSGYILSHILYTASTIGAVILPVYIVSMCGECRILVVLHSFSIFIDNICGLSGRVYCPIRHVSLSSLYVLHTNTSCINMSLSTLSWWRVK